MKGSDENVGLLAKIIERIKGRLHDTTTNRTDYNTGGGENMRDVLEIIGNIVLYIPRRIVGHFNYISELEQENCELTQSVTNRDILLKRIVETVDCNSYGNISLKLRKIKDLAQTFPDDEC